MTVAYNRFGSDAGDLRLTITRVTDPGDDLAEVLPPGPEERLIVFEWSVFNPRGAAGATVERDAARLRFTSRGETSNRGAELVTVGPRSAPETIGDGQTVRVRAVFVVPDTARPAELRFSFGFGGTVRYRFL